MTLDNFKIGKYVKLNEDLIYKISYNILIEMKE